MVRNVIKKFVLSASRLYGESTLVNLAGVAFLFMPKKPHVEAALMLLRRLINELLCDSQFIGELNSYYDNCDNTKYIPITE